MNTTFIDCPRCRRSTPARGVTQHFADVGHYSRRWAGQGSGHIADCAECGTSSVVPTYRLVKVGTRAGRVRGCDGTCTSGKRSCDCRCNGRCHGAGTCYCASNERKD